jgi:hypothetical protein
MPVSPFWAGNGRSRAWIAGRSCITVASRHAGIALWAKHGRLRSCIASFATIASIACASTIASGTRHGRWRARIASLASLAPIALRTWNRRFRTGIAALASLAPAPRQPIASVSTVATWASLSPRRTSDIEGRAGVAAVTSLAR